MANPLSRRPAAWIVAAFAAMAVAITVLLGEAVTLAARRRRKPGPSRRQTRRRAGERLSPDPGDSPDRGNAALELRLLSAGRHVSPAVTGPVMRGHFPARDLDGMDPAPALYVIRINGLGATVLSAFPAMAPRYHGAHTVLTVLTGVLDRSALYGVLAKIEALGLDLLEVRQLTPDRKSPKSGDSCSP
jgi:hypothetical protein